MATTTKTTSIAKFLAPLAKLGKTALQKKYREIFGRSTRSDNVQHLRTEQPSTAAPEPLRALQTANRDLVGAGSTFWFGLPSA